MSKTRFTVLELKVVLETLAGGDGQAAFSHEAVEILHALGVCFFERVLQREQIVHQRAQDVGRDEDGYELHSEPQQHFRGVGRHGRDVPQ